MKILFSVGNFGFLRNFEPALRLLAERGHDLHLLAERKDSVGGTKTLELLLRDYPDRIRYSYAPTAQGRCGSRSPRSCACRSTTGAISIRGTTTRRACARAARRRRRRLRRRGRARAARCGSRAVLACDAHGRPHHRARDAATATRVEALLARSSPTCCLLTPLLYFGSQQVEYVRAARALGIRTRARRRQLGSPDDEGAAFTSGPIACSSGTRRSGPRRPSCTAFRRSA